jgi:AAA15 family ATPase/GTPase
MLTSLQMTNFRQFKELTIEPLSRVNLIAGSNGMGKTSILEALNLLFGEADYFDLVSSTFRQVEGLSQKSSIKPLDRDEGVQAQVVTRNPRIRRVEYIEPDSEQDRDRERLVQSFWDWLKFNKKNTFRIDCKSSDSSDNSKWRYSAHLNVENKNLRFELVWQENEEPTIESFVIEETGKAKIRLRNKSSRKHRNWPSIEAFPTKIFSPFEDSNLFNQVTVKRRGKERLTELLQIVEPRLNKLEYVKLDTPEPVIYAELDMDDLIPATQLGQGFARLLRIFSGILASEAKIVLIDEIENGLHWTALEQVWRGIAELTRQQDVQIFATTHSLECIRAAHNVFVQLSNGNGYGDGFALHRLDRKKDGGVKVVTYDQETLQTSFEQNWEVR